MGQDRREVERLTNCRVNGKLKSLDLSEPYIWRLAITAGEYEELKTVLGDYISSGGGNISLLLEEHALLVMAYLAEWFKREYTGSETGATERKLRLSTDDVKTLWRCSGINTDKYVYQSDSGIHLWQYSIYVLGGLAVRQELGRHDRGRFLKALCRIYHGDDYTLENLVEVGRAIAFRKSIAQKDSLYEYLRTILNGDYRPDDAKTRQFLEQVKQANDEVLKSKFRFEWIVTHQPYNDFMTRRLRMWLKPEEVGGGLHQYLRYDRVLLWGVPHPEQQKHLRLYLRWWNHEEMVQEIDLCHPLIDYLNTGCDNGFITMGVERFAPCGNVPVCPFTRFDIVVLDDDNHEYVAQSEEATAYMQLWRIDSWGDDWTSRQIVQRQTAIVYTEAWTANREPDVRKSFKNKKGAVGSHRWNWSYIYSEITLRDDRGNKLTFYNREGFDQIYAHLYNHIIRYEQGGLVKHRIEDNEEGEIIEYLPLIFGKEDIRVRHFKTKDAIQEAMPEQEIVADSVEYKQSNGLFTTWTDSEKPLFGIVGIRVTVKGIPSVLKMIYLPSMEMEKPIVRNLVSNTIKYRDVNGKEKTYTDRIVLTKQPLAPSVDICYGTEKENFVVRVYRPTTIKEVYLDGNITGYLENGKNKITIPYVLKRRVMFTDFSEEGYKVYDLNDFGSLFEKTGGDAMAHLKHWKDGISWQAKIWNENAPSWLNVSIGNSCETDMTGLRFYYWNYDEVTEPIEVTYDYEMAKGSVLFQCMKQTGIPFTCMDSRYGKKDPFNRTKRNVSVLRCFEIAREHKIYYFIFEPLRKMVEQGKVKEKLYLPLLESRNGKPTEEDIAELQRFADDYHFDWSEYGINLEV